MSGACTVAAREFVHSARNPRRANFWGSRARGLVVRSPSHSFAAVGAARRGHSRGFQRPTLCSMVLARALCARLVPGGASKERKRAGNLFRKWLRCSRMRRGQSMSLLAPLRPRRARRRPRYGARRAAAARVARGHRHRRGGGHRRGRRAALRARGRQGAAAAPAWRKRNLAPPHGTSRAHSLPPPRPPPRRWCLLGASIALE